MLPSGLPVSARWTTVLPPDVTRSVVHHVFASTVPRTAAESSRWFFRRKPVDPPSG
jgi:hypothetical protein